MPITLYFYVASEHIFSMRSVQPNSQQSTYYDIHMLDFTIA
jgi:hypothetical protein